MARLDAVRRGLLYSNSVPHGAATRVQFPPPPPSRTWARCWLVVLRVREPAFFVAGPGAGETRPRLCAKESHDDANHGQDYDRQRQRPRAHGWSVRRSTLHVEALPNQIQGRITSGISG